MNPSNAFRPRFGQVLTIVMGLIAVISIAGMLGTTGISGFAQFGGLPLLLAALVWAVFYKPRLEVSDGELVIVNPLRTVHLVWPSIKGFETNWGMTVLSAYGKFTAWSVPAPSRGFARPGRIGWGVESRSNAADDVAGRVASPAVQEALARWEALKAAGYLDNPRLEAPRPKASWNFDVILICAVLAVWTAVGLLGM
ncbi:PH domain-containing protein [Saxibacter everestensis]|uniref:PH domain-containing protein n=1 Tax=Saxibacter everestensis TaxID=2909229 RepID=A0ABY8QNP2_9MICO|nr:PH domain-containing protein [Brevibacteriaceae bacterium ZFBP1038]